MENEIDIKIEERFMEYQSGKDVKEFEAQIRNRNIAKKVSAHIGEEVLTESQIRSVAFLLGFDDELGPCGISYTSYQKEIVSKIPVNAIVDLSHHGHLKLKPHRKIAYRRSGVEKAFEELTHEGRLEYTVERLSYALRKI